MSDKKQSAQEQRFADWLDGKSGECEADDETIWQQRKGTVKTLEYHVAMSGEESVPSWDRASGFTSDKTSIWQWRGLPALSMVFSIFAVAIVLFKVELVMQNGGVLLSFAGNNGQLQEQRLAQLVDEKLHSFAQEQQIVLANYAADIKAEQQESNLQLASYIIGAARQERKEDISDFIQYINAQRQDELLELKIQYQQLEQAIKYSKAYQREDVKSFGLKQGNFKSTPANWTTEE